MMMRTDKIRINKSKKLFFWLLQFCIWSIYFLYNYKIVHRVSYQRNPEQFIVVVSYLTLFCYFGIPLTLIIRRLVKHSLQRNRREIYMVFMLITSSIILANIWFLETVFLDSMLRLLGIKTYSTTFQMYMWEIFAASLLLFSWGAVYTFVKLYENWIDQKNQTEKALLLAENANLKMLRYQLNPHFLFNSLGSLRALIRSDKTRAEEMLNRISEFLRYTLVVKEDTEIPLKDEIEAIKNYFAIEKVRFEDKIKIEFDIEESAEYFPIPNFILNPLVENAVKYGMITSKGALSIFIKAEISNKELILSIKNSGSWYNNKQEKGTQSGLKNVAERLEIHYPNNHKFVIEESKEDVKVKICLKRPILKNEG